MRSRRLQPPELTFTNGGDQKVVQTLGVSPTATPLPFVNNVLLDPNAAGGPRLSWSLPSVAHDAVAVRVRNNNIGVGPAGPGCNPQTQRPCVADLVNVTYFPAGTSNITIPPLLYQPGVDYSVEINVVDLRGNYIASGNARNRIMFGDTQRMSRTYINLTALQPASRPRSCRHRRSPTARRPTSSTSATSVRRRCSSTR